MLEYGVAGAQRDLQVSQRVVTAKSLFLLHHRLFIDINSCLIV